MRMSEGHNSAFLSSRFLGRLAATDHKAIGLNYLWLALASVLLGLVLSLVMRAHLVWPGARLPFFDAFPGSPGGYALLTTLHGTLMVFFVLIAAPQAGFGNFLLPLQIGAPDVAFPALNGLSFWLTALSFAGITLSFFLPAASGLNLWIVSAAVFSLAALLTSVNFTVTIIDLRAPGMTLPRMPLTAWAWFLTAILSSLIFSVLLASCLFLLADRFLGAHFFAAAQLAPPLAGFAAPGVAAEWQRLFWFFAQAQVYVAMLPCFGIVSHLVAVFSRKPVWAERAVVVALAAVGLAGFCVWGQHMFATALDPWSPLVFTTLAESLGFPAMIVVLSWFGTLWRGKIQLTSAMLFALGFASLFLSGGLTGLFLANRGLGAGRVTDEFLIGHFHLVMGVAATFSILGALFFWFPKLFGCRLNEPLGKLHFWLTFAGVYCIFLPMHWAGLVDQAGFTREPAAADRVHVFVTVAAMATIAAQSIFVFNFLWSLARRGAVPGANPWSATTLEWREPGAEVPAAPLVYRGAYEFGLPGVAADFIPQHLAPEHVAKIG